MCAGEVSRDHGLGAISVVYGWAIIARKQITFMHVHGSKLILDLKKTRYRCTVTSGHQGSGAGLEGQICAIGVASIEYWREETLRIQRSLWSQNAIF